MSRWIDVIAGALGRHVPETAAAAGYGSSPHMLYSGIDPDGEPFGMIEIIMGGIPAPPRRRRPGRPQLVPAAREHPERVPGDLLPGPGGGVGVVPDSGGAGFHRGGCGVRKVVRFLEPGELSMFDDRHTSHPWGIGGGRYGGCSRKVLVRADGEREAWPARSTSSRSSLATS